MKKPAVYNRVLLPRINLVMGSRFDPMPEVEGRAEALLADRDVIVWEVDPTNFRFQYVSTSAEHILGYPASDWTTDPAFWVERVVHRDDVRDAVSALALATGNGTDQDFEFRARTADGRTIPFRMIVRPLLGLRGVATHMRGLMIALSPPRRSGARSRSGKKVKGAAALTPPLTAISPATTPLHRLP